MWNREKYNLMIANIVKTKQFKGQPIKNKEALYRLLSDRLYVSYDTVKGWTRKKSNGPGSQQVLEELENLLETKLTVYAMKQEEEMNELKCSEFVKCNIKKCYDLIIDYLHSDEFENEEVYCKMRNEVRKYKISIPREIFDKIEACVDEYLEPIIYDHDNFFAELYTEDMGFFDEEGVFHLNDESSTLKHLGLFLEKMMWVENAIENFAMKELYPILVG